MRHNTITTTAAIFAVCLTATEAFATVIDFSDLGGAPYNLVDYDVVPQTFGDSAQADVSYRTLNGGNNWGQTATEFAPYVSYWNSAQYSGDQAIYGTEDGTKAEIRIDAGAGLKFTSISFDFGAYFNTDKFTDYKVFDSAWAQIGSASNYFVSGNTGTIVSFAQDLTSIVLQFGDDWDVGLRSISFETAAAPEPVPLPAGILLAGTALLGLAGTGRMSKHST